MNHLTNLDNLFFYVFWFVRLKLSFMLVHAYINPFNLKRAYEGIKFANLQCCDQNDQEEHGKICFQSV
jgi:hypothetical protein